MRTKRGVIGVVMGLLAAISVSAPAGDAHAQGSAETDRAALVALYNATGGPGWTNSTNLADGGAAVRVVRRDHGRQRSCRGAASRKQWAGWSDPTRAGQLGQPGSVGARPQRVERIDPAWAKRGLAASPERRETVAGKCLGCMTQFAVDVRLPLQAVCPGLRGRRAFPRGHRGRNRAGPAALRRTGWPEGGTMTVWRFIAACIPAEADRAGRMVTRTSGGLQH